ncbi:hypothetical protein PsYK624_014930 [Phanerochaete sordida]|uniref:Uncharacterized protein n=1 Tax=Phanerochaete sordida TaxID=48140 RepID=A0A9P3G0D3_9APHY|nr:hypothetical protein PsYK624_014930 [Phanerochaete sordida]
MTTHVVKAKEPTVLHGQSHYVLRPDDLLVGFKVDTAHVIPGEIDIARFDDALARTLQAYPVHAGRVVRPRDPNDPWTISLGNQGVPVTVIESDADTEVPTNTVIQRPFTLAKPVNVMKYLEHGNDEPLLRMTITRFTKTGSTCVGLCASHLIGDGFVARTFLRLLSQNYQGLAPLDPPPSYTTPAPVPFNAADYGAIPHPDYAYFYPLRGVPPHLVPGGKKPVRVDIRLTAAQIAELRAGVLEQCTERDAPRLSRQDVLVALLAYCLSKADPDNPPIQHICTIVMSRGIPPRPMSSIGNALMWAMTDAAENHASDTVFSIAQRIRRALLKYRDPAYAAAYDAAHAPLALRAINAELAQDFVQRPGHMLVNSSWRFDWTSAHFGFPGQTRFYHTVDLDEPQVLKMFAPNPTRLTDGGWYTRSKDDVEMTFFVHKEQKGAFVELFTAQARNLGLTGDIEWVGDVV